MTIEIIFNYDGNIFEITASVSPSFPAITSGPPDNWAPAEEIEDINIKCISDVSNLDKIILEEAFNKLINTDNKFRDSIETLVFEKASEYDYPEPYYEDLWQ